MVKKYNYNIMVSITLTDDEMRQIMLRVLHFYMNRRDYIIPNFVEQFHINTDFTDSDSQFLMNYYRELNRTPNENRLELIEQLLHQRTENMVINPRQSNRGRTRGRANNRASPQRATRRSRGRANNRSSPQRARGRSRGRSVSQPPSPPARSRSNSRNRLNRERVY